MCASILIGRGEIFIRITFQLHNNGKCKKGIRDISSLSFIIYQQFSIEIFILLSKINVIKSAFRAKQKYIMYVKRVDDRWKMIFYRLVRDDATWIKRKIKKKTRMIQWIKYRYRSYQRLTPIIASSSLYVSMWTINT